MAEVCRKFNTFKRDESAIRVPINRDNAFQELIVLLEIPDFTPV